MARIASSLEPSSPGDGTRQIVIFAAIIAALYFGSEILVPIALAILLSFVLAPAVRALGKIGLGRGLPVAITVIVTFLLIAGLGALIATQVRDLSSDLPRYEATVVRKIQDVQGMSNGGGVQKIEQAIARFSSALNRSSSRAGEAGGSSENVSGPNSQSSAPPTAAPLQVVVVQPPMGPIDTVILVGTPLLHPLSTTLIVVIFVVFILMQREDLRNRAIRLFGANDLQRTTAAINDGAKRLSRYLLTQCVLNATAGVVVGSALWLIGVPSPILLGVLFACMRFVPYVGPVIGAVLPVVLAAAVDPGWTMVIWTVTALLAVEFTIGQLVEPFAYGHNTGLSPIAIIIAATFWTVLWGPIGLLLSTPLTVCLVVLGRHVDSIAFLDVLLGDRPPLTPPEIFYQRMLANDPIEASDHAQSCLTTMSILQYYDDVALPALLLAQDDATQTRIDIERQAKIKASALDVVEDLEHEALDQGAVKEKRHFWRRSKPDAQDHKDPSVDDLIEASAPDELKADGRVLCVGARGPLDDAAAAMLTQVLRSHDIGARTESFCKLSKAEIGTLAVADVAIILVSALDGSSPAFLRFVLRRLHRHAPHAAVVVGTWWRREGRGETDEEIDAAIKDPKVVTFADAVHFCFARGTAAASAPPAVADDGPAQMALSAAS